MLGVIVAVVVVVVVIVVVACAIVVAGVLTISTSVSPTNALCGRSLWIVMVISVFAPTCKSAFVVTSVVWYSKVA